MISEDNIQSHSIIFLKNCYIYIDQHPSSQWRIPFFSLCWVTPVRREFHTCATRPCPHMQIFFSAMQRGCFSISPFRTSFLASQICQNAIVRMNFSLSEHLARDSNNHCRADLKVLRLILIPHLFTSFQIVLTYWHARKVCYKVSSLPQWQHRSSAKMFLIGVVQWGGNHAQITKEQFSFWVEL
jgi:hypothetical protein